jgi:hypothetical protein
MHERTAQSEVAMRRSAVGEIRLVFTGLMDGEVVRRNWRTVMLALRIYSEIPAFVTVQSDFQRIEMLLLVLEE